MKKFIATFDLHYGYERRGGHKVPLHDIKAWNATVAFAKDFQPDIWIAGGDMIDCGVISHHNHGKPGATEGLKLKSDIKDACKLIIAPIVTFSKQQVYITGNHERWLDDLVERQPELEGIIDLTALLGLENWEVIPQGGAYNLGKLTFIHGDQIKGGEHCAKAAVISYERSVRFGHFHTFQAYTKTSALDYKNAKTGMAIPCLCGKTPKYGSGAPNRWTQGFLYGYVNEKDGSFHDNVVIILNGECVVNGKLYKG
jgi:hypothetical protein